MDAGSDMNQDNEPQKKRTRRTDEERRQFIMDQLNRHEQKVEEKVDGQLQRSIKMLEQLKEMARSTSAPSAFCEDVQSACAEALDGLWSASKLKGNKDGGKE